MQIPEVIGFACVFAYTLAGMVSDIRTRKLPNVLTVPVFGAGLLFHIVHGFYTAGFSGAAHDLRFALAGFGVGFGIMLVLWFIGGSGGGDVKFMGALGCWLGSWLTFQVLVLSAMLAGVITMLILSGKTFRLQRMAADRSDASTEKSRKKKDRKSWTQPLRSRDTWVVPFGVPAALATWIIVAIEWSGYGLEWPPFK